jgi:hypothetical protein
MAESTKTAGGKYGVIKDKNGKPIRFQCVVDDECGCEYEGSLFYNNGKNLSGRGGGLKNCRDTHDPNISNSTARAVRGPFKINGEEVAATIAEFEVLYPRPV